MSAFDIFRSFARGSAPAGSQPGQQQTQQPNAQGNNAQVTTATVIAADGTNPANPGASAQPNGKGPVAFGPDKTGTESPMDKFKDLFTVDPSKVKQPNSPLPNLTVDPAKLTAAFKDVDMTKGIDPALLEKATKGDGASMLEVLKQSGQSILAQSAAVTGRVLEGALTELNNNYQNNVIPQVLRNHEINQAVHQDNPILSHPAVAPLLVGLEKQFITQYPDASPSDISQMAKDYMTRFGEAIITSDGRSIAPVATKTGNNNGRPVRKETDWLEYATGDKTV